MRQRRWTLPVQQANNYERGNAFGSAATETDPTKLFDPDRLRKPYEQLCNDGLRWGGPDEVDIIPRQKSNDNATENE